jgi:hypothetical protein
MRRPKPLRQRHSHNRTDWNRRHRGTIAQTHRHCLIARLFDCYPGKVKVNPVKKHIGGNKDGEIIAQPNLRHIITDPNRKKALDTFLLLQSKPRRYLIFIRHGFTPINTVYKSLDSRWSLSRTAMRGGNDNIVSLRTMIQFLLPKSPRIIKDKGKMTKKETSLNLAFYADCLIIVRRK